MQEVNQENNVDNNDILQDKLSSPTIPCAIVGNILHCSTVHAISGRVPRLASSPSFKEIMFDTSVARTSSVNIVLSLSYCAMMGLAPSIDLGRKALVRFGIGEKESKSMAKMQSPIDDIWLPFDMYVAHEDVSSLICIDDMDGVDDYFNNLTNQLPHPGPGPSAPIRPAQGHALFYWSSVGQFQLMTLELHCLPRAFGIPVLWSWQISFSSWLGSSSHT